MSDLFEHFERLLTTSELDQIKAMDTPFKIQQFLDSTLYPAGERNRSPIQVMRERQAHCLDGGLFAVAALRRIGYPPLIVDLQPEPGSDDDHVLALFQEFGCWGAVAKSNYSGLRFREPVYSTIRELVLSYFDDFFNIDGQKTLRTYTAPIDLSPFDDLDWMTEPGGVDAIEKYLKHVDLLPLISAEQAAYLSPLDERSFKAGTLGINMDGAYKPQ